MMNFALLLALGVVLYVVSPSNGQVAFTAINGVVQRPNIGFMTVVTSANANLLKNLGVFKADRDGIYYFVFTALAAENVGFRVSLRKNKIPVVTGFADSKGFNTATMSCVVHLVSGDLFYPYLEEGTLYESRKEDRSYTTFTGFQLDRGNSQGGRPDGLDNVNSGMFDGFDGRSATGNRHKGKLSNETIIENLPSADPRDNILQLVQQEEAKKRQKN